MSIITNIKRRLISYYINSKGWKTDRKFVVIESDDWGSIRMPSKEVYDSFLSLGYPVDKLSYLKYDTLESNEDLESLFKVLRKFKDSKGNHPVITANVIMANPDFEKIKKNDFKEYYYENFAKTLEKYPNRDNVLELYKIGMKEKIFWPQLHGREHLNVNRWIKALQNNQKGVRLAFDNSFFDISHSHTEITEDSFIDALSVNDITEFEFQKKFIVEGAELFYNFFNFYSKSFIAPAYIWSKDIEKYFIEAKIEFLQGNVYQKSPVIGRKNVFKKILHYTGQINEKGILYTVRNGSFEPSSNDNDRSIEKTILQIEKSFKNKKPAIISSHRLNFIGSIVEENRVKNLVLLENLFKEILTRWPDVEFVTSDVLGEIIKNELKTK